MERLERFMGREMKKEGKTPMSGGQPETVGRRLCRPRVWGRGLCFARMGARFLFIEQLNNYYRSVPMYVRWACFVFSVY